VSFVSFALLPEIALVVARLQGFRGPLDGVTSVNLRGCPFQIHKFAHKLYEWSGPEGARGLDLGIILCNVS
jgi:hypothetical protein